MRRLTLVLSAAVAAGLAYPAGALAHGLVGRQDLPIPQWLFAWGAALVLVVSFMALALLWREPRLEEPRVRRLVRVPRWLEPACGAAGVALFAGLVYAGLTGTQTPTENAMPTFVYVLFWVGIAALSGLLGDIFRPFNPWRAVARAASWASRRLADASAPPPLAYPERLGRWPAVGGLIAFGWLELVAANGDAPSVMAMLALLYAAVQWVGMALFGIERWTDRGDAFAVYFGLFARMAPLTAQDGHIVARRPLSGLSQERWLPGTVTLLCAAIGITAFDGASEGPVWVGAAEALQSIYTGLGLAVDTALTAAFTTGLLLSVLIVAAIYHVGVLGMHSVARGWSTRRLSRRFAHSLVPIALAYIVAHYFSLLVFQGQATFALVSDPLGNGTDLFGTAAATIDYTAVSTSVVWYVQVVALVLGHAAALALAHDRALVSFGSKGSAATGGTPATAGAETLAATGGGQTAVRSQYWMLAVMILFTSLGLFLLSAGYA